MNIKIHRGLDQIGGCITEISTDTSRVFIDFGQRIPEQVKANPKYKDMRDMFQNVVDIHTSGHADKATIRKVIEITNPNDVICIHKEADAEL